MSIEINIDELFEMDVEFEDMEYMECLMGVYDHEYRVPSKRMNSKEMMRYQDINYNGEHDEWN